MNNQTLINKYLSRRTFIKGLAGAGLLSACQVEKVFAQTQAPMRVCFIPIQHGWGSGVKAVDEFAGSEYDFELPNYWTPFESIKEHCVFLDGLRGTFWGNAHDVSYSDILTASVPIDAPNDSSLGGPFPRPIGPSIDYLLEKHYNKPALRLSAGYGSWGAPYHPLSFNDRLDNLAYYRTAYDAYQSLFANSSGSGNTTIDPVIAELFPHLSNETNSIIQNINISNERNKLLSYLESVTAVNNKLNTPIVTSGNATLRNIPAQRQNMGAEIDSMLDMVRVAFTNDTHRVAVVGVGEYTSEFTWTDSKGKNYTGSSQYTGDFHHEIAHYNEGKPIDAQYAYAGWTRYNAQKIVNFVNGLKNTLDIDGTTLLDNTIIVLTGEVGNGTHDRAEKSHVIIGGNRVIRGNRWYNVPTVSYDSVGSRDSNGVYKSIKSSTQWFDSKVSQRTHADLYTRIAQITGLNLQTFGIDSLNLQPLDL